MKKFELKRTILGTIYVAVSLCAAFFGGKVASGICFMAFVWSAIVLVGSFSICNNIEAGEATTFKVDKEPVVYNVRYTWICVWISSALLASTGWLGWILAFLFIIAHGALMHTVDAAREAGGQYVK